jgi:hypothetical protein
MSRNDGSSRKPFGHKVKVETSLLERFLDQQHGLRSLITTLHEREERELLSPEAERALAENLDLIHDRLADLAHSISRDQSVSAEGLRAKALVVLEFAEDRSDDIVHTAARALAKNAIAFLDTNQSDGERFAVLR